LPLSSHSVRFLVFYNGDMQKALLGGPHSRDPTYFYYYLHCRHVKIAAVTPAWEQTSIAFEIGKCNAVTMDEEVLGMLTGVGYLCRAG
jgi:hypothetical protein